MQLHRPLFVLLAMMASCTAEDRTDPGTTGGSGGSGGGGGGGGGGPDAEVVPGVPLKHRAAAETCGHDRRESITVAQEGAQGACAVDSDCVDGEDGRCVDFRGDIKCTYNECFDDAACPDGRVCECGGGFWSDNNVCLKQGNCQTDADCGADGYCSPTLGDCGNYSGVVGYYCHTAEDECVNDTDCAGVMLPDGSVGGYCAYNPAGGRWMCSNNQCVG